MRATRKATLKKKIGLVLYMLALYNTSLPPFFSLRLRFFSLTKYIHKSNGCKGCPLAKLKLIYRLSVIGFLFRLSFLFDFAPDTSSREAFDITLWTVYASMYVCRLMHVCMHVCVAHTHDPTHTRDIQHTVLWEYTHTHTCVDSLGRVRCLPSSICIVTNYR